MSDSANETKKGPSRVKLLIFGPIAIALGLGFFLFFFGETTLECDREQHRCTIQQDTILGGDEATVSIDEVHEAEVMEVEHNYPGDHRPRYKAFLKADQGHAPLSHFETSTEDRHQSLVDEVNAFLDDPDQQRLETTDDGGPFIQYGPLAPLFIGLLMLLAGLKP